MNTLVAKVQLSILVSMPSPIFLIVLSIYLVKNNLGCKPNYLVLITMFTAILFRRFFICFVLSLTPRLKWTLQSSLYLLQQQIHHHCGQALKPVEKVSSFGLTLKHLCREDSSKKVHTLVHIKIFELHTKEQSTFYCT